MVYKMSSRPPSLPRIGESVYSVRKVLEEYSAGGDHEPTTVAQQTAQDVSRTRPVKTAPPLAF